MGGKKILNKWKNVLLSNFWSVEAFKFCTTFCVNSFTNTQKYVLIAQGIYFCTALDKAADRNQSFLLVAVCKQ